MRSGKLKKLLVVTECEHWLYQGRIWAPAHFVSEMDLWARMFPEVRMHTRIFYEKPPSEAKPYRQKNITILKAAGAESKDFLDKIRSMKSLPLLLKQLFRDLLWCDAVHVRAPCRQALLALLATRFFHKPLYAKYAAIWAPEKEVPITWLIQKYLLRRLPLNSLVTVYGRLPGDPSYIKSSFTSSITKEQMAVCQRIRRSRTWTEKNHLLWVGRFTPMKDVPNLICSVAMAKLMGLECELSLIGDGYLRGQVEQLIDLLGLQDRIFLLGTQGPEEIYAMMRDSKVLIISSSSSEGMPKVLVEAMATGLPCIGTNIGMIPEILGFGQRGMVAPAGNPRALAEVIVKLCHDPSLWLQLSKNSGEWAADLTIENIVSQYREWLQDAWNCQLQLIGY